MFSFVWIEYLIKFNEKLNIVLDNASIHTSKVVEMRCDILITYSVI